MGASFRLHDAQVGDDTDRPFARQAQAFTRVTAFAVADRGDEVEFIDKGTVGLLEDNQHLLGRTGNFRCATGAWQAHFRLMIVANHGGVDVAETVNLGRTEEAHINTTTLQPVAENLAGGDHGVSGFSQLAVTDRQWQHARLGADRAGLIDQHHVWRGGQARQVGGLGRQADTDEAHGTITQTTGGGDGHHFIGGVAHCAASEALASFALNSVKSAVPRMYSSIQALKDSRLRAIGSQAW
ncbi:hypothetical protein D3C77_68560 [compost metagenome]